MGFYYNSGKEPQDDDGGWRETLAIIFVVFRILAKPLGFIIGSVLGLVFIIWLFSLSPYIGLTALGLVIAAIVARGVWEAKHPPELP